MQTTILVPVQFTMPDGWVAAAPDEVGAPGSAFVALHPASADSGFTGNITLAEHRGTDVVALADAAIRELDTVADRVIVQRRTERGTADAPGLTQRIALTAMVNGMARELVQMQVFLGMGPVTWSVTLTVTQDQLPVVVDDFAAFVRSIEPDV